MRVSALTIGLLLAEAAFAEPGGPPGVGMACHDPDTITIRDVGDSVAVVTYYNSAAKCSKDMDIKMSSPNGIEVRIVVWANPPTAGDSEELNVFPKTPGFFASPPEVQVRDGETVEVWVTGGMS